MGKVYDALRKADAQRQENAPRAGAPILPETRSDRLTDAARGVVPRVRRFAGLRRLLRGGSAVVVGDADANSVNKRRVAMLHPDSFVAEQFRTLRARLDAMSSERPLRTIALTSALPDEGKTTAAVNLALVSAMAVGRRVLLLDCDLRRPQVHTALGLRPEFGITEVLKEQVLAERAICRVDGCNLEVLPVRSTPANPSELLASGRMRELLEQLSRDYDQVILDTPPTLSLPDAKTLSELVDGLVLVVRAGQTSEEDIQAALDVLDRRRLLGVVLNGTRSDAHRYGY